MLAANPREPFIQAQIQPIQEAEQLYRSIKKKVENWLSTRKPILKPNPKQLTRRASSASLKPEHKKATATWRHSS
jgi:hypothetical protein